MNKEPCSICEQYIEGGICDEDKCPVALMKKEIERLKNENFGLGTERDAVLECMDTAVTEAKSEAIREFAERLKATDMSDIVGEQYINGEMYGYFHSNGFEIKVDNLVKEMVGDSND